MTHVLSSWRDASTLNCIDRLHRNNATQFCDTLAEEFNRIMTYSMPNLPRFLFWGNDMIDILLLSSYDIRQSERHRKDNVIETPMELLTRRRGSRHFNQRGAQDHLPPSHQRI